VGKTKRFEFHDFLSLMPECAGDGAAAGISLTVNASKTGLMSRFRLRAATMLFSLTNSGPATFAISAASSPHGLQIVGARLRHIENRWPQTKH